jgi:riboflavin kinase/FMN adenylyltransferase
LPSFHDYATILAKRPLGKGAFNLCPRVPMSIEQQLPPFDPGRDTAITIGTFDGVHLGHQHLLRALREKAKKQGLVSVALTFRNQPRTVLAPQHQPQYLASWEQRQRLILEQGIDHIVPLDFTRELSETKAEAFVKALGGQLRMKGMVVGPDFALGHKRQGTIPVLRELGREMGFWLHVVEPLAEGGQAVRSRSLRQLVTEGDVKAAAVLLGRLYSLTGTVAHGDARGRELGFPTANLLVEPELLVPGNGIYATWAVLKGQRRPSATSIGVRPTFGGGARLIETYIMDFNDDIYGETMTVEFVSRLREEKAFVSVAELVSQMDRDVEQAKAILSGSVK